MRESNNHSKQKKIRQEGSKYIEQHLATESIRTYLSFEWGAKCSIDMNG